MSDENIRLVITDLDGTLLNDQRKITPYSASVLSKVRKAGIAICFASGRDEQMMAPYIQQIGGCDYVLSNNGALVRGPDQKILYSSYLSEDDVAYILTFLNQEQYTFMMYEADTMYFSEQSEALQQRIFQCEALSREIGFPIKLRCNALHRNAPVQGHASVSKIVIYETAPERVQKFVAAMGLRCGIHCETTGYGLMGAFHCKVSKKTALEQIIRHMGISTDHICVFGDYDNDISMFQCAKHRICVANAAPTLKAYATDIARSNQEDGVARYLETLLSL